MKYNIWLMPYSNFAGDNYNPSKGLAVKIKEALREKSSEEKQYICRIKRVGVNIYDVDEAVDEVEFLDNSGQLKIDVVIAIGEGGVSMPELFQFEHTGSAARNEIPDQCDLYGRPIYQSEQESVDKTSIKEIKTLQELIDKTSIKESKTLQEYGVKIKGQVAGWYSNEDVNHLVRECEKKAGKKKESKEAGNYLCGYMTEKLAASPTLTNKGFFIHTEDYKPTEEDPKRDEAGRLIADFIESFCDLNLSTGQKFQRLKKFIILEIQVSQDRPQMIQPVAENTFG